MGIVVILFVKQQANYSCFIYDSMHKSEFIRQNLTMEINKDIFFKTIKSPVIKEKLKEATKNAHEKEIFGAPTFIVNNKIFWGQDRLEFALDEYNKID